MDQRTSRKKQTLNQSKYYENNNIEWILNLIDSFPKYELQQINMKPISAHYKQRIQDQDKLLGSSIFTYTIVNYQFTKTDFTLYPNLLVQEGQQYLILSTCLLQRKTIQYKEFQAQGLILSNENGNTYLFFESYLVLVSWYKKLKVFCKLQNFLAKFTVKERHNVPNVFACVKNKNSKIHLNHSLLFQKKDKLYTVQIFRQNDLEKNVSTYEALMNEVNIVMSFKHQCLLNYFALYEDQQHLYILYEYWVGDPLFKLVQQGLKLQSTHIAHIIFQLVKFVKFLHQNNLYHGLITPANVIVLRSFVNNSNADFKIILIGFGYREENASNWPWLVKRLVKQWTPPEILEAGHNNHIDPQKIDSYQIGCTLYYLLQIKPTLNKQSVPNFAKSVENFQISYNAIQQCEIPTDLKPTSSIEGFLFTQSQLNILLGLLEIDPQKRLSVKDACKHHWFINEKSKSIKMKQNKQQILPSLKTILELREMSSAEINSIREINKIKVSNDYVISLMSSGSSSEEDEDYVQDEELRLQDYLKQINYLAFTLHPSKISHK